MMSPGDSREGAIYDRAYKRGLEAGLQQAKELYFANSITEWARKILGWEKNIIPEPLENFQTAKELIVKLYEKYGLAKEPVKPGDCYPMRDGKVEE